MNLKKIAVATLFAFSLTMTPAPSIAATTDVELFVQNLSGQNDTVNIFYNNARGGYIYQVYLNNNFSRLIATGTFTNDSGQITLNKANYPDLANIGRDERLTVRVVSPENLKIVSEKTLSLQASPKAPTDMRILNGTLYNDRTNSLEIAFDKNYVPSGQDRLNFYPLDASGNVIQNGQRQVYDIYKSDLTTRGSEQVVTLNVNVPKDVKAYRVVFTSGNEELSKLTQKVTIGEKISEVKRLIIDFPTTAVGLDDTIRVRVLAEDSYGRRNDISKLADLTFSGDAIRTRDYYRQEFTVYNNTNYLGKTIRIQARYKGVNQEVNVRVVRDKVADTYNSATNTGSTYSLELKQTDLKTGSNYVQFQVRDNRGNKKALPFVAKEVQVSLLSGNAKAITTSARLAESSRLNQTGEGLLELSFGEAASGQLIAIFKGDNPTDIYTVNSQNIRVTGSNVAISPSTGSASSSSSEGAKSVLLFFNSQSLLVDGQSKKTTTLPAIVQGRTYVPLRTVAEAFGAKVTWDKSARSANAKLGDTEIKMLIGQKSYLKNGIRQSMDAKAYINKQGSTMVPVRYVAEAFGYKLNYNKVQISFTK